MELVGLKPEHVNRFPHEFSGGQRQRIGIARAIALDPDLLVLDEPVSALDVSIQAGIVNLLEDIQAEFDMAFLFIAHDLSVVRHISDQVAVMYLGNIVETGTRRRPLRAARRTPTPRPCCRPCRCPTPASSASARRIVLEGDPPNPADPPSGCRFRTRCWKATQKCADEVPGAGSTAARATRWRATTPRSRSSSDPMGHPVRRAALLGSAARARVLAAGCSVFADDDGGDTDAVDATEQALPSTATVLRVASAQWPECLNPLTCPDDVARTLVLQHVVPRLIELDADGGYVPSPVLAGAPEVRVDDETGEQNIVFVLPRRPGGTTAGRSRAAT